MASDIVITPNRGSTSVNAKIDFTGASTASSQIRLEVLPDNSLSFVGTTGSLFSIADSVTGSLMSVNDASGLPILEVFDTDKVVMGQYNQNTLVVNGTNIGVGTASPNSKLEIRGGTSNQTNDATLYVTADNDNDWAITIDKWRSSATDFGLQLKTASAASYAFGLYGSGSLNARWAGNGELYVPRMYDSTATAYYVDPGSTSNLNGLTVAGTITGSISGNAATATTATTATNWGSYGTVPAAGTSFGTANTIGRSDANGYAYFYYINSSTSNNENGTVSQFVITNGSDNFYRKASLSHVKSQIGLSASDNPQFNSIGLAIAASGTAGSISLNQSGTRSWSITPTGGNLVFASGDSAGTISISTNLTVAGNLTVNGTTTTVNSTTVTIDDPIFTLGGDTAPASDDNKDRGIEFRWHNGTAAKAGFFGFDDSTGYFTFIPDATNTSEVFSGTQGDIQASNFRGNIVGGTVTVAGTLTINKNGTNSDIIFPAQANDPGYIRHYESNNTAIMYFNVSDDTNDEFHFGYTGDPSTFRLRSDGTVLEGIWQGSSIATTYTDAKVATLTGQGGRILIQGGVSASAQTLGLSIPVAFDQTLKNNARNITGGGTITVSASYEVKWGTRFIIISGGRGANYATSGYWDIDCPTSGTITGVGGAANQTANANGIPLGSWQALYYILPIGSGNASLAANFRLVHYSSDLDIPIDWVLICIRSGDSGYVHFPNGITLAPGESSYNGVQISTNVSNSVVKRDGSGNFSAGTVTAALSGNATTATTLQTARTIAGVSFNGSANITLTGQNISTSSGTAANDIEVAKYLRWKNYGNNHILIDASAGTNPGGGAIDRYTPGNTINSTGAGSNTWGEAISLMGWNGSATYGVRVDRARSIDNQANSATITATSANTASQIVQRDSNGDFSARNITTQDYYTNGWFRNNNSNSGLYNQSTFLHLSSQGTNTSYLDISTVGSTNSGIRFYTGGHVNTLRGYIVANTSNELMLWNAGGSYSARFTSTQSEIYQDTYVPTLYGNIMYDRQSTSFYVDPGSTSVLNRLNVAGYPMRSSTTIDMSNTGTYSTTNYYPVTIPLVYGMPTRMRIVNALNSNVPSWSTHAGGFTCHVEWTSNGSGWGTIAVQRSIHRYTEGYTNSTICGGITQMTNSSNEVIWLRGGGIYYFEADSDVLPTPRSTTLTLNGQSVTPGSAAQNDVISAATDTRPSFQRLNLTQSTGTAPMTVSSTTLVTNLNADLLDGLNSASTNTASTIVARDASGNFSAGTITATLTGTASALVTGNNYQVNSFGVGTAASGTAGEIRATNNITAYYSDDRLKTKLGAIENPIEKVKSLSGFYFEANETAVALGYQKKREVGVSAQEVQAILPEIIAPAPIDDKYMTVRYEKLIPLLIEAIKEQQKQIEELKSLLSNNK